MALFFMSVIVVNPCDITQITDKINQKGTQIGTKQGKGENTIF